MKHDATGEAGTPPTRGALDRRTELLFIRMVANSPDHPCQAYFEEWELPRGDTAPLESWLRRSNEGLWLWRQPIEQTTPLPLRFPACLEPPRKGIQITRIYIRMAHVGNPPVMV
jgi:hypothetical protein